MQREYEENMSIISEHTPDDEILATLAEEAAELAQAALKYRRSIGTGNPTPVPKEEAYRVLYDELGDVLTCFDALEYPYPVWEENCTQNCERKAQRWADRLEAEEL